MVSGHLRRNPRDRTLTRMTTADGPDFTEYPLFPLDLFPKATPGAIAYIRILRVELDENGNERKVVVPHRFNEPVNVDEISIAEVAGGGVFDVQGVTDRNKFLCGRRIEIEGT